MKCPKCKQDVDRIIGNGNDLTRFHCDDCQSRDMMHVKIGAAMFIPIMAIVVGVVAVFGQ